MRGQLPRHALPKQVVTPQLPRRPWPGFPPRCARRPHGGVAHSYRWLPGTIRCAGGVKAALHVDLATLAEDSDSPVLA
jgi:hypothetical protein